MLIGGGGREENMKPSWSFTTLSTIAIQATHSQVVINVLKSGSLVHLQLIQVHPGLCEIGSNIDENQTLILEHQRLMEKLKKHEGEVLAVVENKRQTELRRRRIMEQKKNNENHEDEKLYKAMAASLREGWSLLLRLLERRQEVLTLASDFYHQVLEFGVSMDRAEDLHIKADDDRLTEVKLTYASMRRDLLQKSLQVLSSSSTLLQRLRQLQRTEALQRTGAVLQDEEQESSQCSRGIVFRLEELVEMLQARRRRVDQVVKLQLQQVENGITVHKKEEFRLAGSEDWNLLQNLQCGSTSAETTDLQAGSKEPIDPHPGSRSEARELHLSTADLQSSTRFNLKPGSRSETRDSQYESTSLDIKYLEPGSGLYLQSDLQSKETKYLQSGARSVLQSRSSSEEIRDLHFGARSPVKPGSKAVSEETKNLQPGSQSEDSRDFQPGPASEVEDICLSVPGMRLDKTTEHRAASAASSRQMVGLEGMLGNESQFQEDHAHQTILANQRQQLLSLCDQLMCKVCSWVEQGSSVLSHCSEGQWLCDAEDALNTHLQLRKQTESADCDAAIMKQILDQIRTLHTDPSITTCAQSPSGPSRLRSPLKALTEQLKRGSSSRQTRTSTGHAVLSGSLSPEFIGRVDLVLKELQNLNRKIDSNLQLLQPYVVFLRTAQQVEDKLEKLRELYRRRSMDDEDNGHSHIRSGTSSRAAVKQKQEDTCWQQMLQSFFAVQKLGNNYVHNVTMVSGSGLNPQAMMSVVQQTVDRLGRTKQEVNELRRHQQIQIQTQQKDFKYCMKYRERLFKTQQDLNCVSELLDSCTLMDLGSDLLTSRLLEQFNQARPHFAQLEAEVEYMVKSWETLRGVQDRLEVKGGAVKQEDLSELLKLQRSVKKKIQQTKLILDLTSRFHLTAKQLEVLLQSDPRSPLTGSTGFCASSEAEMRWHREEQQQIQSLFQMISALTTDICITLQNSGSTCFRVEQLEDRLLSLDSLCTSWLEEAEPLKERLCRELLARQLSDDIIQLHDSFKELKKRFSNLKFNYMKRNDRSRNTKAIRNQLHQVELCEEKLQVLRKRLQSVTSRLGSEVKDGGIAREREHTVNELQRQMGEFEQSVSEHLKTLDMTSRLQQAMEEFQLWCEEASVTIARVGKISSACCSTEAVSVLYQQFERFIWPTVPQQEERISQISELALRLHGVEEGQRYMEKTVSKHSEMVTSIRELSDGLLELEAKLKQQNGGGKVKEEEGETKWSRESETQEKDEEKWENLEENTKMKKEQTHPSSTQTAADLKESGSPLELTDLVDDSLSIDEYECPSPDDISLPPLAETPESNTVQSDVEEGFSFSSHISHFSHQFHAQSEHSGTGSPMGAVRQHRASRQACPTPPTSTRIRSKSSSFVQSPSTFPDPGLVTIPRTSESSTANFSQSGPNLGHSSNTPDSWYNKNSNVPENKSPSKLCPELTQHNIQYNHPQSSTATQSKNTQNVTFKRETLPLADPLSKSQQIVHCKPLPSDSPCNVAEVRRSLISQKESPFSQALPDAHTAILPGPSSISNISISSTDRLSSKQNHHTVSSLHESLTSTHTQECVHDAGMTPSSSAKPAAPLQPKPQTPALAQQANLHVTPPCLPSHLLTPDQDPDICQPMAICEKIRLTPQIQGPSFPAPPLPKAQAESPPKGKASKPAPPLLDQASV
ncbi:coiled-coil domain-containing protein 141 isoform X2 [Mastacembelus armatus]|uniref:coiled-coil domain-containing protein 141 isoform X2 n=1 Tax=Mastacembelus armatus TaxID=205130 RepID=UPI000E45C790|nr:coiled-coil domain-containing protein 141 isoform X2 [Mastacembelus armatus]